MLHVDVLCTCNSTTMAKRIGSDKFCVLQCLVLQYFLASHHQTWAGPPHYGDEDALLVPLAHAARLHHERRWPKGHGPIVDDARSPTPLAWLLHQKRQRDRGENELSSITIWTMTAQLAEKSVARSPGGGHERSQYRPWWCPGSNQVAKGMRTSGSCVNAGHTLERRSCFNICRLSFSHVPMVHWKTISISYILKTFLGFLVTLECSITLENAQIIAKLLLDHWE